MRLGLLVFLLWAASAPRAHTLQGELTPLMRVAPDELGGDGRIGTAMHLAGVGTLELSPTFRAEVDLRVWLTPAQRDGLQLLDNSSRLSLRFTPSGWAPGEGLSASLFPFSAETLDLGFAEPVRWGRRLYLSENSSRQQTIHGAEVRFQRAQFLAFLSSRVDSRSLDPAQRAIAVHQGGFGVQLPFGFRIDASGAWGPSRRLPRLAQQGVPGDHLQRGLTFRAAHASERHVEPVLDFGLYGQAPEFPSHLRISLPTARSDGLDWFVSLEATRLLIDLDSPERFAEIKQENGTALALDARGQWQGVRLQALAWHKDVTFTQAEAPGIPPFSALPEGTHTSPERALRIAADYAIRPLSLTPGVAATVTWPAYFVPPGIAGGSESSNGANLLKVLVHAPNRVAILPSGIEIQPTLDTSVLLRWDPHPALTVFGEAGRRVDPNRYSFRQDTTGLVHFQPDDTIDWFGTLLAQVRI